MNTKSYLPIIEALESRIAPAGVIDVIVRGGTLILHTLPDGDGSESLVISNGPNANDFLLDPSPGTKLRVNGVELADDQGEYVEGITGLVSISLGAGDDQLVLANTKFAGGLKVDLGNGNNSVSLDDAIAAALSVKGGANNDDVSMKKATIGGLVTIDLGAGTNSTRTDESVIAGNLTIKGGSGDDTITNLGVAPLQIGGKLATALRDGNNVIGMVASLIVGKDVSFTGGKGQDIVALGMYNCVVGGNFTVNSGTGPDVTALVCGGVLQVAKDLTLTSSGAPGESIVQRVQTTFGLSVGGNVTLKSGTASSVAQELYSALGDVAAIGSISIKSGLGEATQYIYAGEVLTVGKGISFVAKGGGTQSIYTEPDNILGGIGGSGVSGPVNITGGRYISLAVNGDLRGPVNLALGQSASGGSVYVGDTDEDSILRIHGPLTVKTNSPDGALVGVGLINTILLQDITLLGGAGMDQFYLYDIQALGSVKINAGAGDDDLLVEKSSPLIGRTTFLGTVTFKGGAGNDDVAWSSGDLGYDRVFAAKLVTIDGGAGTDTFTAGSGATFFVPVRTLGLS